MLEVLKDLLEDKDANIGAIFSILKSLIKSDKLTEDLHGVLDEIGDDKYKLSLPLDYINRLSKVISDNEFDMLCMSQNLTKEFILDNKSRIDFSKLNMSTYFNLDINDIGLDSNVNWNYISLRDDLSVDFVRKFKDKLNWDYVTTNIYFTEKELEEFSDYINLELVALLDGRRLSKSYKESVDLESVIDNIETLDVPEPLMSDFDTYNIDKILYSELGESILTKLISEHLVDLTDTDEDSE